MPTLIEKFTRGKISGDNYNEDRLILGEHCYGVIDSYRGPDYRDTDFIQDTVERARHILSAIDNQSDPLNVTSALTAMVAERKGHYGHDTIRYTGGFSFACYSFHHKQIWRVGDCPFRFNGKTYLNETEIEFIGAKQRAVMLHAMMVRGHTIKEIMASTEYEHSFDPFLKPLLDFVNHETHQYGFGEIIGLPVPRKFIEIIDIPDEVQELIFSSDGYPILCDSLQQSEEELTNLLNRDPLCITDYIAAKGLTLNQASFDDRTYLRFAL